MPPGIQNNPNVNTNAVNNPPPSNTPPPDAARTDGAQRPPADSSAPPPDSTRPPADSAGGAGNPGALPGTNTGQDLTRLFEGNEHVQQQLMDVGAQGDQVAQAQDGNSTSRADTSESRVQGQQADGQVDDRGAQRSFVSSQAQQQLTDAPNTQRQFASFLTQGSVPPNPNRPANNQGQQDAAVNREFQVLQDAMNRGQPEGAFAGRRPGTTDQQPTYRAHAFGFLARDVNTGRQMGYIVTRQPIASQAGRTPENPENPEAHAQDTPHGEETAHAGRFAAAARPRVPGERRVGADRANDDNTDNDNAGEGSGEGGAVANREASDTNPVIAAFLSQHGGGGQGEEGEAQSTREVIDNAVVVFGEASPDDAARLRSEHTVGSAITAGTGHYVHRLNLGQRSGNGGQSGVPSGEEALVMGAAGVHAGRESDMGELRRLSLNVNGEMIDMGSPQGQARFEEICSTNPEVREAAMGLVEQRRNFTTHVTANLFRADGGEPSARA